MSWTDERVEKLKKMWGDGQSASQIAKELGGVTRNAVIGKVHRLGLSNRNGGGGASAESGAKAKAKPAAKAQPAPKSASEPAAENPAQTPCKDRAQPAAASAEPGLSRARSIVPANQPLPPQPSVNEIDPEALAKFHQIEEKALRLTLMELTEKTCKWPIGDPATEDFYFCGLPVAPGKPYCEPCVGVAYQSMSARRDRRR
ncbi:MAG: GcrA family cell cycle regulator [Pseudomonadota bacterium]